MSPTPPSDNEPMTMPKIIRLFSKSDLVTLFIAYLEEIGITDGVSNDENRMDGSKPERPPHPRTIYR